MEKFWPAPFIQPPLQKGLAQVWKIDFSSEMQPFPDIKGIRSDCWDVLNTSEKERAQRMRAGRPRDEFIIGRGYLRRLLAGVLELQPQDIVLEQGTNGKLSLAGHSYLHFNITHSGRRILISLSYDCEVGVDLEAEQAGIEVVDIAKSCFHPEELALLDDQSSESARLHAFYLCWTRKEAVAKADGRGLALALESFSVAPVSEGEREVSVVHSDRSASLWVREINAGSGYAAAFAACKPGVRLECFDTARLG